MNNLVYCAYCYGIEQDRTHLKITMVVTRKYNMLEKTTVL